MANQVLFTKTNGMPSPTPHPSPTPRYPTPSSSHPRPSPPCHPPTQQVFQKKAYRASYRALNLARTAKWIGYFDVDEYFVPEENEQLASLLSYYEADDVAAVAFNRLVRVQKSRYKALQKPES
jgi:hypothetical protein